MRSLPLDRQAPPGKSTGQRYDTGSIKAGVRPPGGTDTLTVAAVAAPAHRLLDAGATARAAAEPSMGYGVEPAADRGAPAARLPGRRDDAGQPRGHLRGALRPG